MPEHATPEPNPTTDARDTNADELGAEGSLVVEDHHIAIVAEWVITAQVSDAAFRLYSMLMRFGNISGQRMPSRALLATRLHRSVDSIDRALRELSAAGIVRVEERPWHLAGFIPAGGFVDPGRPGWRPRAGTRRRGGRSWPARR